ncbi:MAG TPA: DUF2170 family protein [Rhodospirillales bacterium]|nr:DUF2170 family protein [Rhodospirillales bacterium]
MATKRPSYYQSRYRDRLRQQGYVKREVWIPPDYTQVLKECESALRAGVVPIIPKMGKERNMNQINNWDTQTLFEALGQSVPAAEGAIEVELVEGAEPGILLTMKEFGDLPILMSVSGSQIIVDTLLWPVGEAEDSAAFNTIILKTHKLFPLSTFGITRGPDDQDYYEMFGSLSSGSLLESVIFEIETLADNALQAAEAYQSDLKKVA